MKIIIHAENGNEAISIALQMGFEVITCQMLGFCKYSKTCNWILKCL